MFSKAKRQATLTYMLSKASSSKKPQLQRSLFSFISLFYTIFLLCFDDWVFLCQLQCSLIVFI